MKKLFGSWFCIEFLLTVNDVFNVPLKLGLAEGWHRNPQPNSGRCLVLFNITSIYIVLLYRSIGAYMYITFNSVSHRLKHLLDLYCRFGLPSLFERLG